MFKTLPLLGAAGTLGAVCKIYFDMPRHAGCPFQDVCVQENDVYPVERYATRSILHTVDAVTLEKMAAAIRLTEKKEVKHEAVVPVAE
jgi:hypothetical protein